MTGIDLLTEVSGLSVTFQLSYLQDHPGCNPVAIILILKKYSPIKDRSDTWSEKMAVVGSKFIPTGTGYPLIKAISNCSSSSVIPEESKRLPCSIIESVFSYGPVYCI